MTSLFYGWVIVGAGFAVLFLTYGVQYAFGLFFTELSAEFGWSRASLSGVFSLYAGTYSFLGMVAGRLTDRWGPRRVVALGGLLLGSGLAASSTVNAVTTLYATYFVAALGMSTAYVPCSATVVRWFTARRGLAVGLVISGAGVGILACPPLVGRLIAAVGWRTAYLVLGAALAGLLAGLSRLLVADPAALAQAPYGGAAAEPAGRRWSLGRIARDRAFLALAGVYTSTWLFVFLPTVHLAPLARDLGLPPAVAAAALSALGAGSLAGRLVLSALSDRIGRRAALGISLGLQAASFAALAIAVAAPGLLAAATAYGFAYGAVTALLPAIAADLFGPAHAGSIVGLIFGIAGPAAALGPVLGGWVYDLTGSYGWAFGAAGGSNVLALALLALARPPASDAMPDDRATPLP